MMAEAHRRNHMTLNELIKGIVNVSLDMTIEVRKLVMDSRIIQTGDLFIALPGLNVDGREFIDSAIEHGASAVLWECEQGVVPIPIAWRQSSSGTRIPVIAVENLTHQVGVLADRYYHHPSKSMFVVGITGTNGKTSCSQFIAEAINPATPCAMMGTMGWGFPGELNASTHTTPDAIHCHQWLDELLQQGAKSVAMEVSSHALDQGRVTGVAFDCAVFTNLSHDHLDYHRDMESYAAAKQKLFLLPDTKHYVINIDDEFGTSLAQQLHGASCLRYGIKSEADITATDISLTQAGLKFRLHTPVGEGIVQSSVYGKFNVYNLLATAGVLLSMGYDINQIVQRLSALSGVAGRLQAITAPQQPVFIVDYAHTPDALENALCAIKDHFDGRIWCVMGCGGDRDKHKRPKMAAIAEAMAQHVVLTNDNPRSESPMAIINDMLAGMHQPEKVKIELDREAAIVYASQHASSGDVIVVAGKGHETYQQIGDRKLPFSDKAIIDRLLSEAAHD